jgi:hypothetical protein
MECGLVDARAKALIIGRYIHYMPGANFYVWHREALLTVHVLYLLV